MSSMGIDPVAATISGITAIKNIRQAKVEENAQLDELIEELYFNIKLVRTDYLKNGIAVATINPLIKTTKLESAERARKRKKLDFNKIKPGFISQTCFISNHQIKYYSNFNTELVLLKLRDKVTEIKKVRKLYYSRGNWRRGVNPIRRMKNIVELLELISNHLSEK